MTVKQLQEYLADFKPEAQVVIWEWNNPNEGDNTHFCQIGANDIYQKENQIVQLYRGLPVG